MKHLSYLFVLALALPVACGEKRGADADALDVDSLAVDTVSADTIAYEDPPAAADGLFDDFLFNYMRNARFQKSRTRFPLEVSENGEKKLVEKDAWKYQPFFTKWDVYTLFFASLEGRSAANDTAVKSAAVEIMSLKQQTYRRHHFQKLRGAWCLTDVSARSLAECPNADFLEFYKKFATNAAFRSKHVLKKFYYDGPNFDTDAPMRGNIAAANWETYAPELPDDRLTNIVYGTPDAPNETVVLVLTDADGSLSSTMVFKKSGNTWFATTLINN